MFFSKPKLILVQQRMFTQEIYQLFVYKFLNNFTETIQKTYGAVIVHKKFSSCLYIGMIFAILNSSG